MRFAIVLVPLLFGSIVLAAEHPPWTNLSKLQGQSKDSAAVVAFVRANELKEITKGPSGAFTPDDYAYSILYRENRVKTIILKISPPPGGFAEANWRSYTGTLPYKLVAEDGRTDVVKKLGQPQQPSGDTWHHDGLEIWVFFNKAESGINELYISPSELDKKP